MELTAAKNTRPQIDSHKPMAVLILGHLQDLSRADLVS